MLLPHHYVELLAPALIQFAETAVAVALGVGVAVLFPEQLQGDVAVGAELLVDGGEVGRRFLRLQLRLRGRIQGRFQVSVIPAIRQRPGYLSCLGALQILVHRTDGDGAAAGDLTLVEFQFVSKS